MPLIISSHFWWPFLLLILHYFRHFIVFFFTLLTLIFAIYFRHLFIAPCRFCLLYWLAIAIFAADWLRYLRHYIAIAWYFHWAFILMPWWFSPQFCHCYWCRHVWWLPIAIYWCADISMIAAADYADAIIFIFPAIVLIATIDALYLFSLMAMILLPLSLFSLSISLILPMIFHFIELRHWCHLFKILIFIDIAAMILMLSLLDYFYLVSSLRWLLMPLRLQAFSRPPAFHRRRLPPLRRSPPAAHAISPRHYHHAFITLFTLIHYAADLYFVAAIFAIDWLRDYAICFSFRRCHCFRRFCCHADASHITSHDYYIDYCHYLLLYAIYALRHYADIRHYWLHISFFHAIYSLHFLMLMLFFSFPWQHALMMFMLDIYHFHYMTFRHWHFIDLIFALFSPFIAIFDISLPLYYFELIASFAPWAFIIAFICWWCSLRAADIAAPLRLKSAIILRLMLMPLLHFSATLTDDISPILTLRPCHCCCHWCCRHYALLPMPRHWCWCFAFITMPPFIRFDYYRRRTPAAFDYYADYVKITLITPSSLSLLPLIESPLQPLQDALLRLPLRHYCRYITLFTPCRCCWLLLPFRLLIFTIFLWLFHALLHAACAADIAIFHLYITWHYFRHAIFINIYLRHLLLPITLICYIVNIDIDTSFIYAYIYIDA